MSEGGRSDHSTPLVSQVTACTPGVQFLFTEFTGVGSVVLNSPNLSQETFGPFSDRKESGTRGFQTGADSPPSERRGGGGVRTLVSWRL